MLEELMMKNQILSWNRLTELGWNPRVSLIYSSSERGLKCLTVLLCLHFEVISAGFSMVLSPVDVFVGCQGATRVCSRRRWRSTEKHSLAFLGKAFSKNFGTAPRLFLSLQRFLWADSWCCQKIEELRFLRALLNLRQFNFGVPRR